MIFHCLSIFLNAGLIPSCGEINIQAHLQPSIHLGGKAQWKQRQMWRRLPWWPRRRGGVSLRSWGTCGRPSVPPHDFPRCSSCSSPQTPPSQRLQPSHLWNRRRSERMTLLESWRWWNARSRRPVASVRVPAERWHLHLSCCYCRSRGRRWKRRENNDKLWFKGKGGQEPWEAPEQGKKIIKTKGRKGGPKMRKVSRRAGCVRDTEEEQQRLVKVKKKSQPAAPAVIFN